MTLSANSHAHVPQSMTRPIAPLVNAKPSLTTEQAAKLLINGGVRDLNQDGTIKVIYEFFSKTKKPKPSLSYPERPKRKSKRPDSTRTTILGRLGEHPFYGATRTYASG
ncbi:hypothetical protein [Pseudomonas khavaziana]|uniref:hypothetical protein n=1 Tax=Pseudomonas khavaziana TaxID=2842351 RepID=UPI001CED83B9|nr:hypothetical protein [Pseudomonas khavaziana]